MTQVTLDKYAQFVVDQYNKSSLQEIAKSMQFHADCIRKAENESFKEKLLSNTLKDDPNWRLVDSFEQIAFHLNFHVIPYIK